MSQLSQATTKAMTAAEVGEVNGTSKSHAYHNDSLRYCNVTWLEVAVHQHSSLQSQEQAKRSVGQSCTATAPRAAPAERGAIYLSARIAIGLNASYRPFLRVFGSRAGRIGSIVTVIISDTLIISYFVALISFYFCFMRCILIYVLTIRFCRGILKRALSWFSLGLRQSAHFVLDDISL